MKRISATLPVAFCAFFAAFTTLAAAQSTPPGAADLQTARQHLAAGRVAEARAALRGVPASADSVRLTGDIALASGDLRAALDAYESLTGRFKTSAPDLLRSIAVARATGLRTSADTRVGVDACDVLMAGGAPADCATFLNRTAMNADVEAGTRIAAALVLEQRGARDGAKLVDMVIATTMVSSPDAAAVALASLPPARSTEPLKTLAFSENRDARYLAATALARRRTPEVIPTLRAIVADQRPGSPRIIAHIGLAGTGDGESVRVVREAFPQLDGQERLDAALALRLAKVPEASSAIDELTMGPQEMVRLEAAESLHATRPQDAERLITAGLASGNPWIKIRALEAARNVRMEATPVIRRAMLDGNELVAIAAARLVVAQLTRRQRP